MECSTYRFPLILYVLALLIHFVHFPLSTGSQTDRMNENTTKHRRVTTTSVYTVNPITRVVDTRFAHF